MGVDPFAVRLRLVVDPDDPFLRECYDDWERDKAYYRAHPEEEVSPGYMRELSFEEYVREIAESRLEELMQSDADSGFRLEVVEPKPLKVETAEADEYGQYVRVESDGPVAVWGCGCCDLFVLPGEPDDVSGGWKPAEIVNDHGMWGPA